MYVITGATGHTGRAIVEKLLAEGKPVRAVARNAEHLKPLAAKGAEPFVGSLEDADAMARAFSGAEGVYTLVPTPLTAPDVRASQNRVGEALATAIAKARVPFVVNLSSVGAHLSEKVGPVKGLHDVEQRFNRLEGVNVLHLRPTFFMENFLMNVPMIKNMGIHGTPMKPDIAVPLIATKDIAAEAAERLLRLDFKGKSVKELLGPRELTMTEVTAILGRAIGKPSLPYIQFPYEDAEKAMIGMGLSPDVARGYIEMYRAFNDGIMKPTEKRSAKNTTPTSFEAFAEEFAAIYKQ
ncbi:MAG: NmrA family NAD(P)-binding protein [Candidatus Manganitrophus sp.]|nr:MAG: NmrA family NAD(P)-binding protein [Candidatus Manganitrophus sp.]